MIVKEPGKIKNGMGKVVMENDFFEVGEEVGIKSAYLIDGQIEKVRVYNSTIEALLPSSAVIIISFDRVKFYNM